MEAVSQRDNCFVGGVIYDIWDMDLDSQPIRYGGLIGTGAGILAFLGMTGFGEATAQTLSSLIGGVFTVMSELLLADGTTTTGSAVASIGAGIGTGAVALTLIVFVGFFSLYLVSLGRHTAQNTMARFS